MELSETQRRGDKMATSSRTMKGAEGGNNRDGRGGWHQGRLVPGLTFETNWEERAFKAQRDPEGRLEWWEHTCAGEGDTRGGLELARAGHVLSSPGPLAPGPLAGCDI